MLLFLCGEENVLRRRRLFFEDDLGGVGVGVRVRGRGLLG